MEQNREQLESRVRELERDLQNARWWLAYYRDKAEIFHGLWQGLCTESGDDHDRRYDGQKCEDDRA